MKILTNPLRLTLAGLTSLVLSVPTAGVAATYYLDQNGPTAGLWDGVTTPIGADMTTTTNWTTTAAGTAGTTIISAANNIQIGNTVSDFNGATIIITNNFNGSIGGNPASFTIVSTNAKVIFLGTAVNERYNHATTWSVTNGSTLSMSGNNYNYNAQVYTLAGNGTINVSNVLGNNDSTSGGGIIMNMIGGKLNLYQTSIGTYGNGTGGSGFTLTNGTVNFVSPQSFGDVFADFQNGANNTVKLNGGSIDNLSGAPGTLNVNAGSYSIGGNFTYIGSSQSMSLGSANVALIANSQIGVNGNTFTIGGTINDSGAGLGITKAGAGTLVLAGANSYTGPTVVNGGTLVVNTGSTGGGAFTNNDGGTLDLQVLRVGQQITMSGLTAGSVNGSTLQFDVGVLGNPAVAPITLNAGTLTVNGTNTISLNSISFITNYPVVIPLISYGTYSGAGKFVAGTFPAASPAYAGYISNDTVNLVIDLVLTNGLVSAPPPAPQSIAWNGITNGVIQGNWDTTTLNWTFTGSPTNYVALTSSGAGDPVVFDDTLAGTTNINLTTTLAPASVTFNNTLSNYMFTGTGSLSGSGTLAVNGYGCVVLDNSGNNNFSGGVNITNGTLQIGNNDANGGYGTGGVTNNGALTIDRSDAAFAITIPISGFGAISNIGSGTVTIATGQPNFTGQLVVNAGTLAVNTPNAAISGLYYSTNITINSGTVVVDGDNALQGSTGRVPVNVYTNGILTGLGTADSGAGTSSHLGGLLTLNGGTLAMGGTQNNTSHGTWDLDGGVTVPGGGTVSTISALNVIPSQTGGTIFNVTNGTTAGGIDLLVSGTFINGSSTHDTGIIKYGPGVMELDNNNAYSGGTTVGGGVLQLGGGSDSAALVSPLGTGAGVALSGGSVLRLSSSKGVTITNVISDDGTCTLLATNGTNVLTSANSYSGTTLVTAGTLSLQVAGSINSSATITISNATFDISKSGTALNNGAAVVTLTNSTFTVGTNLVASLSTLGMGKTTVGLNLAESPNVANITVGGALNLNGLTNVINMLSVLGQPAYPADIPLIKYGSFANVNGQNVLTNLGLILPAFGSPTGYLTNNTVNGSIDFILTSDTLPAVYPITWNGRTNGVNTASWDVLTTPDWVLTTNLAQAYLYQDATPVTFDDNAAGTTAVSINATVSPASVLFTNNSKTYSVTGAGKISGPASISMQGSGTVYLGETGDSFSGGVSVNSGKLVMTNSAPAFGGGMTVNNGTLVFAATNAATTGGMTVNNGLLLDQHSGTVNGNATLNGGLLVLDQAGGIAGNLNITSGTAQVGTNDAGGVLPTGTITANGTLIFDRTDAVLNVTAAISGGGTLANNGTGTVTLSTTEPFTGAVIANAGTLVLNAGNNTAPNGLGHAASLTINTNATVAVLVDNSLVGHGAVAGTLPIFINAGGVLTGAQGADTGGGISCHISGLITFGGGTLTNSGTSLNGANGSWDLDGGVATSGQPFTSYMSALSMVDSQAGGTLFNIPSGGTPNGIDLDVIGTIIHATAQGDTGIFKSNNGTMALDNNNTYTGGTTIQGGTLQLGSAMDSNILNTPAGAATGAISISGSSTLKLAGNKGVTVGNIIGDDGTGTLLATSGVNTLTGANTYTGQTLVTGGTLALGGTGSINSSASITVSNGTFDVSATATAVSSAGSLTLNNGTFNVGGSNVVSALGSLTASNGTIGMLINPAAVNITVTSLAAIGNTNVVKFATLPGLPVYPTNFTLINYSSFANVNGGNVLTNLGLSLPAVGNPTGYLTNLNNSIQLVLTSGLPPVNTNSATVTSSFAGNQLTLTWPLANVSWSLQVMTNTLAKGLLGTNWVNVPGANAVNSETFTINPANGSVFYRLTYP